MRLEVLTQPERRRRWSDEEKRRIIGEAMEPGVRYADVARRHGISAPQLYQWRVALREGQLPDPIGGGPRFVAVHEDDGAAPAEAAGSPSRVSIEIALAGGRVLRTTSSLPSSELRRLIRAVEGA